MDGWFGLVGAIVFVLCLTSPLNLNSCGCCIRTDLVILLV